jgi:hypothetical protein
MTAFRAVHLAPRPISIGNAKTPAIAARVGKREMVKRRTTPVVRSAMTKEYRFEIKSLQGNRRNQGE